ncbi:hypothetical protein OPT61_g6035 [Boeremia exigua]|uniref:Uncharacterized protein n=1 Tax=Boeremia exigua TaxID=749465 RepID=A0ACC2I898_9PLEO|nr:hypothetical protein OPT61_g6035 [Boeremia exigua]
MDGWRHAPKGTYLTSAGRTPQRVVVITSNASVAHVFDRESSNKRLNSDGHTFVTTMASLTADQVSPSRLLQLPREIRDLIWECAIVRDTIPIDCAVFEGPGYRRHTGYPCPYSPQLREAYPLHRKVTWRRTWSLPVYDLKVDIQGGTWMEPKRARMTYQLASPCARPNERRTEDKIAIQLLQVCRTISTEAKPLFYSKNVFSFTGRFPISTALAFLQDRPAAALSQLSSIEMVLTEDNNMRGTPEAHFPSVTRSSDCLVLQYAFQYFTDLCTLLSSSAIRLRRLYLTIESLSSYGDSQPEVLSDCLAWEVEKCSSARPWVASWIQPLLQIESLETIKVYWISDRPRVRRMSDTLSLMQHSMLKNENTSPCHGGHAMRSHELDFSIYKSHCDHTMTTLIFDPRAEHLECGECSCENRPAGLQQLSEESPAAMKSFYKCGVATWKEHQSSYTGHRSAYTAYCELISSCSPRKARRKSSACAVHWIADSRNM